MKVVIPESEAHRRWRFENKEIINQRQRNRRKSSTSRLEWERSYRVKNRESLKLKHREFRLNNSEKSKVWQLRWRSKNKPMLALQAKRFREKNPGYYTQYWRDYRNKNRGKIRAYLIARKARVRGAGVGDPHVSGLIIKWKSECGFNCEYCGGLFGIYDLHIEHRTPIVRGGKHEVSNICKSCPRCNLSKGVKTSEEFLESERPLSKL